MGSRSLPGHRDRKTAVARCDRDGRPTKSCGCSDRGPYPGTLATRNTIILSVNPALGLLDGVRSGPGFGHRYGGASCIVYPGSVGGHVIPGRLLNLNSEIPVRERQHNMGIMGINNHRMTRRIKIDFTADKPHPDSEVEFWHVGNLTACGTSPSQGEV